MKFKVGDYFITTPSEKNIGVVIDVINNTYHIQWVQLGRRSVRNDFCEYEIFQFDSLVRKLPIEEVMIYLLEAQ